MSGNIMGLIGVTILAVIGTVVVVIDQRVKRHHTKDKNEAAHKG